jgi:hypothetical protein
MSIKYALEFFNVFFRTLPVTNSDLEVDVALQSQQSPVPSQLSPEPKDTSLRFQDHWTSRQRNCVLIIASLAVIMVGYAASTTAACVLIKQYTHR